MTTQLATTMTDNAMVQSIVVINSSRFCLCRFSLYALFIRATPKTMPRLLLTNKRYLIKLRRPTSLAEYQRFDCALLYDSL